MEEYWFQFRQILTFSMFILLGLFGETVTVDKSDKSPFFNRHYDCIPVLSHSGVTIDSTLLEDGSHLDNVSLQFVAFGRQLTVDLSLNRQLFPQSYVETVFHFNKSGVKSNNTEARIPENCYYHGSVRGRGMSEAAISTCDDAISGYITDQRDTYHIEPWKGRIHRVYRNSDQRKLPFRCGTMSHDHRLHSHQQIIKRYKRSIRAPYDSNRNTRYVELYLVNDYRTYERHGKNKDIVIKRSQNVANIVSGLYRQLNIYVALVGVEVWGAGDLITISKSADNTMENFLRYRRERINPTHHNDNAQLITGKSFEHGVVGKAVKGPICTHQHSGGVNMDYGGPLGLVATTVAHEMGHNFGMEHDNDTMCECRDEKCIMAATSGQISPRHWSSCSQNSLAEAFDLGMDYCLKNIPTTIYNGPVCGNGFKEDGEECDCGLPKDCLNLCCDPKTCKMYSKAQCATGMCCDLVQCKPKMASTMCREPRGECDLPEYCDGQSEYCPENYFVQDGHVCRSGESYCYKGQCNTHTNQCKLLWGESGRVSDPICFQQLNTKGNGDGSCAYNWTTNRYTRCDRENVLCGLLHCVHLNEKLMFWKDNLALVMKENFLSRGNTKYVCRSAMLDVGLDMKDPGLVPDGSKCEHNKICIDQKCVPIAKLDVEPCPDNCKGRGRCNSNNSCHCDTGYAPPFCDRPGYGGSIDGGSASNVYAEKDSLIHLLIVLLVLIFVALGILAYCNRGLLQKWLNRVPNIKYRVKGKSEKTRPPSLLESSAAVSRSDSSVSGVNPPVHVQKSNIWTPVKTAGKTPPKRPSTAPKRLSSAGKSGSCEDKEQLANENSSFSINQTDAGMMFNAVPPNNIPNSPKSSSKNIVRRESIRGSKISEPVLMSTTNRNSVVLADMQVDIIGPEADREPRTNSPSQRPKANSIKRNLSDRQSTPSDPPNQRPVSHLTKSASVKPSSNTPAATSTNTFQPRPPPELTDSDEEKGLITEMDMEALLQDIENRLKNDTVYYNLSNGEPFESAVLEIDNPPELPPRKSTIANGVVSQKSFGKPTETQGTEPSALPITNSVTPAREKHFSTPSFKSSSNENKTFATRSSNNPVEELKSRLQSKPENPIPSPKKVTNSSAVSKPIATKKPKPRNNAPSNLSNLKNSLNSTTTNNMKNKNDTQTDNQQTGDAKLSKASLSRTNSADGSKPTVSNLAARFSQGGETTEKITPSAAVKPVIRRNTTVPGVISAKGDKPEIGAKPVPPPKPVNSGDRSPSSRPGAGIKRVHSYRV